MSRGITGLPLPAQSFTFDANDRLNTDTYDANGNTLLGAGFGQSLADEYDFENRLVTRHTSSCTIHIAYDGDGNRVSKTLTTATNNVTTYYVVDNLNPSGYSQVLEEHTSLNSQPSAVNCVYTYGDTLISQDRFNGVQWVPSFYGYDGHINVRYLTDANANVTDTYEYDAFGNLVGQIGSTANCYLFTGEQFDADLGLYSLRSRYQNPDTGRFWTVDSNQGANLDPLTLHKYLYGNDDPVNLYDPSGQASVAELTGVEEIDSILQTVGKAQRLIGKLNKVKGLVDLMIGFRQVLSEVGTEMSSGDWTKIIPRKRFSLADAAETFGALSLQGFAIASPNWVVGYLEYLAENKPITAYLIYLPTFVPWPREIIISTGAKISGKPLRLVAGAIGRRRLGGLMGVGVSAGGDNLQLLRMDLGFLREGHGGEAGLKDGELDILDQDNYHMHVYGWGHFSNK